MKLANLFLPQRSDVATRDGSEWPKKVAETWKVAGWGRKSGKVGWKKRKVVRGSKLTGRVKQGKLIDAEAAKALHGCRTIAGKGDLEGFSCCIRLCGREGAHHAASSVEPDCLCVSGRSWWWEQLQHEGGQIEAPTGVQPVSVAVRLLEGLEDTAEEGVAEGDRLCRRAVRKVEEGHGLRTSVAVHIVE